MYQTGNRSPDSVVLRSIGARHAVQRSFKSVSPAAFDAGKTHVIMRGAA
jgi:hypothetical protein